MSVVKRGRIGVSGKSYFIFSRIRGSKEVISMISSLRRFDKDEVATQRMRIINFYKTYGERATKEAFGVDRKLIYTSRRRIRTRGNHIAALRPDSTSPKNTRKMMIDYRALEYIRTLPDYLCSNR